MYENKMNNCIHYDDDINCEICNDNLNYMNFDNINFNIDEFKKIIQTNFARFKINQEQDLLHETFQLQNQQKFVPQYANFKNNFGNLLIYHNLGSGKTCTSILVGEAYKAFTSDSRTRNQKKIIVATPKAIVESYRQELIGLCVKHIKDENCKEVNYNVETNSELDIVENPNTEEQIQQNRLAEKVQKKRLKEIKQKINKYWNITTHDKLINQLIRIDKQNKEKLGELVNELDGSLIIIDEVQNLISEFGKKYHKLSYILNIYGQNSRIILLSATPIYDKPFEIGLTLNLLNPRIYFPTSKKEFNSMFKLNNNQSKEMFYWMCSGYISYFSGGNPKNFPITRIIKLYHKMNHEQENEYIKQLYYESKETDDDNNDNNDNSNRNIKSYYVRTRQVLNIYRPTDKKRKFVNRYFKKNTINTYSEKIDQILKRVTNGEKRKILIFSDLLDYGCNIIAHLLKTIYQYEEYIPNKTKLTSKPRFTLWTGKKNYTNTEIETLLKVINSEKNTNGEYIEIIIGSTTIMEGISFYDMKEVHIVNPWWNEARIQQVIARAIRFKSHKYLPPDKQFVNVFKHYSIYQGQLTRNEIITRLKNMNILDPNINKIKTIINTNMHKKTIDTYMEQVSKGKYERTRKYLNLLKQSAVDCELNHAGNLVRLIQYIVQKHTDNGIVYEMYYQNPSNGMITQKQEIQNIQNIHNIINQKPTFENGDGIYNEEINCNIKGDNTYISTKQIQTTDNYILYGKALSDYAYENEDMFKETVARHLHNNKIQIPTEDKTYSKYEMYFFNQIQEHYKFESDDIKYIFGSEPFDDLQNKTKQKHIKDAIEFANEIKTFDYDELVDFFHNFSFGNNLFI